MPLLFGDARDSCGWRRAFYQILGMRIHGVFFFLRCCFEKRIGAWFIKQTPAPARELEAAIGWSVLAVGCFAADDFFEAAGEAFIESIS